MVDESLTADALPRDPYGDVALGVECAWPESIPLIEPEEDE